MNEPGLAEESEQGAGPAGPGSPRPLTERTITAAQWRLASSVVQGTLQFGISVLLARLLPPEDFGLVALALVVVGFATVVADLGLGPALVQRTDVTDRHLRVSLTLSTLIGALLAALVVAGAPLAATLLRNPAVTPVLRGEALMFVFVGLGTTARALLQKDLDFRRLFYVELVSYGIGYPLVAVTMALMGMGVWSLVAGALVQNFLGALFAIAFVRHPLRPLVSRPEVRDLLGFGVGVTLNRTVVYVALNGDNLVVGRWLGASALGLYARAFQLMGFPLGFVASVAWNILFAAYSQIRGDAERLSRAYLKGVQLTVLLGAPVMAGMVTAGPHLVLGLYGPGWEGATLPLQILCCVGVLRGVYHATGAVTHALGQVYAEFRRQAAFTVLLIAGAYLGTRWGLVGVSVGVAGAIVFMYLAMAQLGVRLTGCGWGRFFGAQVPGFLIALLVAGVAMAVRLPLEQQGVGSLWILAAMVAACAAALPLGVYLLPERVRPLDLFRNMDTVVARLPVPLRLPLRRVMRISAAV